jgi:hypothetical protein
MIKQVNLDGTRSTQNVGAIYVPKFSQKKKKKRNEETNTRGIDIGR